MRRFRCPRCAAEVFVDSTVCLSCGAPLAFDPHAAVVRDADRVVTCANAGVIGCNWIADPGALCASCATTRTRPVDGRDAVAGWTRAERAKRRLALQLMSVGLPFGPGRGPVFDMLHSDDGSISIGHADGVITIDVGEADDARRARLREFLGEPYRTLLGHLRHEVGHFYWPSLVAGDAARLTDFRAIFGDERADYAEALDRHYREGPAADWRESYVSAYATMHPWEDWAECFAHLMHIHSTLDTAAAHWLAIRGAAAADAIAGDPPSLDRMLDVWMPLSVAVNAMNRSMDQPDLYPFVITGPVREKLRFVHGAVFGHPR